MRRYCLKYVIKEGLYHGRVVVSEMESLVNNLQRDNKLSYTKLFN